MFTVAWLTSVHFVYVKYAVVTYVISKGTCIYVLCRDCKQAKSGVIVNSLKAQGSFFVLLVKLL